MKSTVVDSYAHRRCDLQRLVLRHRVHGKRSSSLAHEVEVVRSATGTSRTIVAAADEVFTEVIVAVVTM
jgi:hypothetical protein